MNGAALFGLFLAAFGAATLLPLQSEALLAGLIALGDMPVWLLLAVATAGNVGGSMLNWLLGRGLERWRTRRWFPVSPANLARAQLSYQRFGYWTLLLSWVPVVGDPLTVIAGTMREPFWRFTLLVLTAKLGRYLVVAALAAHWRL